MMDFYAKDPAKRFSSEKTTHKYAAHPITPPRLKVMVMQSWSSLTRISGFKYYSSRYGAKQNIFRTKTENIYFINRSRWILFPKKKYCKKEIWWSGKIKILKKIKKKIFMPKGHMPT